MMTHVTDSDRDSVLLTASALDQRKDVGVVDAARQAGRWLTATLGDGYDGGRSTRSGGTVLMDTKRAWDNAGSSVFEGRLTDHASDARARTGKCSVLGRQQPAGPCRLQAFVSR